MTDRDPKCVHVENDAATANFVASWLRSQGIPARVMNEEVSGGFEGLTGVSENLGYRGPEVWVDDVADADRARKLFAEKEKELRAERAAALGPVEAVCSECGTRSTFHADARGSVQECPSCASYIDIPGADDDWDDTEIDASAEEANE